MPADTTFHVGNVMSLTDLVSGPLRFIQGSMATTEAATSSVTARLVTFTTKMAKSALIGAGFLAVFGKIATTVIPTQKALGELSSVGVTDMRALEAAATSFSNNFSGTQKAEFLAAAYDIKSGISSLSDVGVAEFTKLAALTGKATKSNTAEMTSLFATGYGIYKNFYNEMSDFQFGEMFSAGISASVQAFKTTGSGMAQAISTLGAEATTANVPLQEQLAIMGMLQATMSGSEAGTKYKSLVQGIARAAKKLGLPFLDANNQIKPLPVILDILKGKFGETLDAAEKLQLKKAFRRDEAIAAINLLYGKVGDLRGNILSLNLAMRQGQGFTLKMAQTMNNDLGAVIDITKQKFSNMLEMVGGMLAPILGNVAGSIGNIVGFAMTWIEKNAELTQTILFLVGGLSVAVVGITLFSAAGAGLSMAMTWLAGTIAAVSAPVWVLMGVISLLYLAWRANFGGIADMLTGFYNKSGLVLKGVYALFKNLAGSKSYLDAELAKELKAEGLFGLVVTLGKILYRGKELMGGFADGVSSILSGVYDSFLWLVSAVSPVLGPLFDIIKSLATELFGLTAATDVSGWKTFGKAAGGVFAVLAAGFVIAKVLGGGLFVLVPVIKILGAVLFALISPVGLIIIGVAALAYGIYKLWQNWDMVIGAFNNWGPVAAVKAAFSEVVEFLSGINLFESGMSILNTLGDGIRAAVSGVLETVTGGFNKIRNMLPFSDAKEGPLSQLTYSGKQLMATIGEGVTLGTPGLKQAVSGALAGVALATSVAVVPPPKSPVTVPPAEKINIEARSNRSGNKGNKTIRIVINGLVLPNVKDANDFVKELERLVQQYDS